jgi:PAS domain-containing protein
MLKEEEVEYTSVYHSLLRGQRYSIDADDLIDSIQWEKEEFMSDMPVSAYWKDEKGVILGCNQYMLDMFNLKDKSEIVGKTNYYILSEERAKELEEVDRRVMMYGETVVQKELSEVFVNKKK